MLARKLGVSPVYLETGSRSTRRRSASSGSPQRSSSCGSSDDPSGVDRDLHGLVEESIQAGDLAAAARGETTLGLVAFGEGDVPATIELLERALTRTDPSPSAQPDFYATLGRAYSMHGDPDKAVALFRSCLERLAAEEPAHRRLHPLRDLSQLRALRPERHPGRAGRGARRPRAGAGGLRSLHARAPVLGAGAPGRGARARARGSRQRAACDRVARGDRGHAPPGPGAPARASILMLPGGDPDQAHEQLERAEELFGPRAASGDLGHLRTVQARSPPPPARTRPRSPSPTRHSSCSVTTTFEPGPGVVGDRRGRGQRGPNRRCERGVRPRRGRARRAEPARGADRAAQHLGTRSAQGRP